MRTTQPPSPVTRAQDDDVIRGRVPELPIDPPRDYDAEMAEAAEDAGVTVAEFLAALEPDWGDVLQEREYYDH